jgi:hypothetical protein
MPRSPVNAFGAARLSLTMAENAMYISIKEKHSAFSA